MISTNKLIDIYNAWGEKNDLHPMSDPRDMKHDARLNKKEVSWIDKFLKVFEKADKIEQSISKLFMFNERTSRYILKSDAHFVIDVYKGTKKKPRPTFKVNIDGEIFETTHNLYDAMKSLLWRAKWSKIKRGI